MKTVLTILKQLYESDKSQALAIIQSLEGGVVGFLKNLLDEVHAGGLAGVAINELKSALEGGLDAYVAAHGPEVVYQWIDALLAEAVAKA